MWQGARDRRWATGVLLPRLLQAIPWLRLPATPDLARKDLIIDRLNRPAIGFCSTCKLELLLAIVLTKSEQPRRPAQFHFAACA